MSINNFSAIQVRLASPEKILEWSHGEVTKPETINYRSQKAERDGLFCERIFGPTKDWECACGKYKKNHYKGVVCDRCGVEITKSSVRRERMGHIHLAAPVAHIWYLRGIPSRMALLLDVTPKQLEEVVYFVSYIVTDAKDSPLSYKQILSEREYRENMSMYGTSAFEAKTGAEAVLKLLEEVDLEQEYQTIQDCLKGASGEKQKKLIKRLETINAFRHSNNLPEWMILTNIPVIPPDLRPMLQLDGGRFATSDLNDLYRRVITRNNRLRKLLDLGTPNIIVQNEKRMLQEAVDALIDNGRRSKAITGAGGRELKSLTHSLKGKQGRFRQNLLGKRVDFSGRSVIAVGPDLKMYECGIPREMAVNLFKPFIINAIVNESGISEKTAEKRIEKLDNSIWDVVEKVIDGYPVLMNRAPTLHRLGIQAFLPKLVEGRAMRLHPLVCGAFNADFDGDQMAIHVPLSEEARAEALIMMLGSHNILGPKDGKPIVTPGQDMVMGNYYLTMEESTEEFLQEADRYDEKGCADEAVMWRRFASNQGHVYADVDEVMMAYKTHQIHLHSRVAVPVRGMGKASFDPIHANDYLVVTPGKIIFNSMFPSDFPFIEVVSDENFEKTPDIFFIPQGQDVKAYIEQLQYLDVLNGKRYSDEKKDDFSIRKRAIKKKDLGRVIAEVFRRYDVDQTSEILDQIKSLGFRYSTVAGITVALSDIEVAPNKEAKVEEGRQKAEHLKYLQRKGMLTMPEWESNLNLLWDKIKGEITDNLVENMDRKNPIFMMADSGARGNKQNFAQLAGMRGLMARPGHAKSTSGEFAPSLIEVPIYSCFREGLNVSEFFTSTHGVRKGLTDTALKTAESGYLTRRLVDVAQGVIIKEDDCGTDKGYWVEDIVEKKNDNGNDDSIIETLKDRITGRFAKQDVINPKTGELIIGSDEYITDDIAKTIVDAGIKGMYIRSVFTCNSKMGICSKCYGKNMATGNVVEVGESVGVMAAQSIGEPGTQLTMRTFHTGGVAGAGTGDITQGLPRVEELFEARSPKGVAVISQLAGQVEQISDIEGTMRKEIVIKGVIKKEGIESHKIHPNQTMIVKKGDGVQAGDPLTEGSLDSKKKKDAAVVTQISGRIDDIVDIEDSMYKEIVIKGTIEKEETISHKINANQTIIVEKGDSIEAGQPLTEGPLDPKELMRYAGPEKVQQYILKEVKKVYQAQGIEISDKHLEVMIMQMMKNVIVTDSGDTDLNIGVKLSRSTINKINQPYLLSMDERPAKIKPILLGISKSSVETDSFLSAASFQETTKVLTDATIKGKIDELKGMKENVMIGKLIPAGTGIREGHRQQNDLVEEKARELRSKRLARKKSSAEDGEKFNKVYNKDNSEINDLVEEAVVPEDQE